MANKPTVLIVDDDKLIVAMLSDILAEHFEIATATDGDEAIAWLEVNAPQAVLCDQNMPTVAGVEVLERCLRLHPHAVRIMITATDRIADLVEATNRARVHQVLVKPVREVELPGIIKGAIHEVELERENERLVKELQGAVAQLQERERELERELKARDEELRHVLRQLQKPEA